MDPALKYTLSLIGIMVALWLLTYLADRIDHHEWQRRRDRARKAREQWLDSEVQMIAGRPNGEDKR